MADKTISGELHGKDSPSSTFQKVGAAATAAGKTIDIAGRSVGKMAKESLVAAVAPSG
jgi:hypothetical protein